MNKPQTCIPLQEYAQQPHRKKRLIDRREETAFFFSGGMGWEKGEKKGGSQGMKGWMAGQSVKRGDKTLASVPKERKGEDFTR